VEFGLSIADKLMHSLYHLFSTRTFLGIDASGEPSPKRLRICIAALLWEMAAADGRICSQEIAKILESLQNELQQSESAAVEMLEIAEVMRREQAEMMPVFKEINEHLADAQRERLFELLWQVALADAFLHPFEKDFAAFLREKLNLPAELSD
jgi:uncharacterized tellurite resistance protein B-like protein